MRFDLIIPMIVDLIVTFQILFPGFSLSFSPLRDLLSFFRFPMDVRNEID